MGINGYGLTLAGGTLGSFSGVEAVTVGGVELAFDEFSTIESYAVGTATFTNGSASVTGSDTAWTSDMAGRQIRRNNYATWYTIASVGGATSITLTAVFAGTNGSGAYTILPTRLVESLPMGVRESPIEVTLVYAKTLYDAMLGALAARTEDEWTLTDSGGSTHVGDGRVAKVGNIQFGADGHATFTVTLTPTTVWSFTPAA